MTDPTKRLKETDVKTLDFETLMAEIEEQKRKRAADMPTQEDALRVMLDAYERLKELGWAPAIYSPKDGTVFEAIEAGCCVPGRCSYLGEWPSGGWWTHEAGDLWPSRPILWRPLAANCVEHENEPEWRKARK